MSDYRKLLPTLCHECVIDVTGWEGDDRAAAEILVGLISSHDHDHFRSWRGKLQRIGAALHGESYPWLEFLDRTEVEAFVDVLQEAADRIWPQQDAAS